MTDSPIIPFWAGEESILVGTLISLRHSLSCYVKLFAAFEGSFTMSTSPQSYQAVDGFFVRIDVRDKATAESSFAEELVRLLGGDGSHDQPS